MIKKIAYVSGIVGAAALTIGAANKFSWETYGEMRLLVSRDQSSISAVNWYVGKPERYFFGCSEPIRLFSRVVDVKFKYRREISSFRASTPKWGIEEYEIDIDELPESRKWILSTLIAKGRRISIISRGCGSGVISYLIAIKKA